jgi:hypothetical protein
VTSPWWAAFGPAQTRIECGTGQHVVRWAEGQLQAADHPDAEGELVLAALGGDATPCLELASGWGKHSDDLAVLAIGPRSHADKLAFSPETLEDVAVARSAPSSGQALIGFAGASSARIFASSHRGGGGFAAVAARRRVLARRRAAGHHAPMLRRRRIVGRPWPWHPGMQSDSTLAELIWLLALGAPFQFRLSAAVAHAWSAEGQHASRAGEERPALSAALAGRLAPAAARWLGVDPAVVEASFHDGSDWGAIEEARVRGERVLQACLPVSWLASVWAPGLAVVGGHLVVSVAHAAWPEADVLALSAPAKKPVELSVRHDEQGWITA